MVAEAVVGSSAGSELAMTYLTAFEGFDAVGGGRSGVSHCDELVADLLSCV